MPAPMFKLTDNRTQRSQHEGFCLDLGVDVDEEDIGTFCSEQCTAADVDRHVAYVVADARRHTEVTLQDLEPGMRKEMEQQKRQELDQWVNNSVFRVCKKSGLSQHQIMSMRCVLTLKRVDGSSDQVKPKARLVIRGYTDPDLITMRAEAPTLSRTGRLLLFQLAASRNWNIYSGDVKTAYLQGSLDSRDCYCSPPKDVRHMLGMKEDEILQLQRAAYGLRNAPRQWYNRVVKDFLDDAEVAWVQHKLDRCVFVCHCCAVGVYVDDFLVIGDSSNPEFQHVFERLKARYHWGKWEHGAFEFCGVKYKQNHDFSITCSQQHYADSMHQAPVRHEGSIPLDAEGFKQLRGINGALSWLAINTRPDIQAQVSSS
eukprot:6485445-Amphidinium_carterae.1